MNLEIAAINPVYRDACIGIMHSKRRRAFSPPTPSQVRRALDKALMDKAARRLKDNREGRIVFREDFQ